MSSLGVCWSDLDDNTFGEPSWRRLTGISSYSGSCTVSDLASLSLPLALGGLLHV